MPLGQKLTKSKARTAKKQTKPVTISPGNLKTISLPKIPVEAITQYRTFKEKLSKSVSDIEIDTEDLPEDLQDVWDDLDEDELKDTFAKKNLALWLSIFSGLVLPAFMKGITGDVEIPPDVPKQAPLPIPTPKVVTDYAKQYFQERGLDLVTTLTETDCNRLKGQMLDNWGKGEDFFKKSFQEDYANTKARLEVIYRTEYIDAQNYGIKARSLDAGFTQKTWNSALDERTCPVCGDQLHGVSLPMDEPFTYVVTHKDGSQEEFEVDRPPAHPTCRCVLTTQKESEDQDEEISQDAAYLDEVSDFIKLNYNCPDSEKVGSGPGSCSNGTSESNQLDSIKDFKISDKPTKNRPTNPDRFVETKLSNNIIPELASRITLVVKSAYKNIPELNGTPLTTKNVDEKEYPELKNAFAAHDNNTIYLNDKYFSNIDELEQKLDKEVKSGFHPKGCNTAESIITHELGHLLFDGMSMRGDDKWDKISEVIYKAKESGELSKVSRYALSEAGNGELSEAASEIFASIFHTREEDQEPVVKQVRNILFDKQVQNATYLAEVSDFMKLNYKCEFNGQDNKCPDTETPDRDSLRDNNKSTNFKEVNSTFNPELGGFHTTDYKQPTGKSLRIISQDKQDNDKLLEALSNVPNEKLPNQFHLMKMVNDVPAKYYSKLDSIGVNRKLSSSEMAIEIKKVLDGIKHNETYLDDVASFVKLNYKCEFNGVDNKCGLDTDKPVAFKPAKTVDDAQKFAQENILNPSRVKQIEEWNSGKTAHTTPDKVQQIKLINYRGIDIKVSNIINKQLLENVNIGLPRPNKIIATQLRKTPNTLMRMGSSGDLELNTIAIGNFKKIDATIAAGKELNSKIGSSEMKMLDANAATMTPVQKLQYNDIKEFMKYPRGAVGYEIDSNPERALISSINHEIAHMLEKHGRYGYDTPQHEEFRNAIREMANITVNSSYKYKLSAYGCKGNYRDRQPDGSWSEPHADPEETFAELYSAYRFHEDDKIHPDVLKMLKKWLPER
jgi:hypothetical protein